MTYIPYGRQDITEADIEAVVEVLRSDWLTQGPMIPRFEQAVADYCGATHAVAVNSGTSALHLACLALGVGPGDTVWTSPNTFVASANCARYCGAEVDFVDIDPRTYNLCSNKLAEKLELAEREGRLPKVVIPVHFAGQPCDMPAIHALSQRYRFKIIEDASHALGASDTAPTNAPPSEPPSYSKVGACRHSDITVFSYHPVKIITTAEGGMALTNHSELAKRMARLRTHGITRDPKELIQPTEGPWYYEQQELGFNYRMTDLQAALGLSQLTRLDEFVAHRQALAARYDEALVDLPVTPPWQRPGTHSAYHLYPIRIQGQTNGANRRAVFDKLREAGIGVNLHYIPVHTQPYYQSLGFRSGSFPEAERYAREAISLPIYPRLGDAQNFVVETLRSILTR